MHFHAATVCFIQQTHERQQHKRRKQATKKICVHWVCVAWAAFGTAYEYPASEQLRKKKANAMIPRKKEQLLNGFFGCSISSCGPIENSICCIVWSLDTEGLSCPKKVAHINFNWHINVIVCLGFIILFGFSYLFFCFSSFRCFRSAFCTACDSKWIQFFFRDFLTLLDYHKWRLTVSGWMDLYVDAISAKNTKRHLILASSRAE